MLRNRRYACRLSSLSIQRSPGMRDRKKKRGWRGIPIFLDTPDEQQRREGNVSASRHGLIETGLDEKAFGRATDEEEIRRGLHSSSFPEKEFVCIWCTAVLPRAEQQETKKEVEGAFISLMNPSPPQHPSPFFYTQSFNVQQKKVRKKRTGEQKWRLEWTRVQRAAKILCMGVLYIKIILTKGGFHTVRVLSSLPRLFSIIPHCGQHTHKKNLVGQLSFHSFFSRIVQTGNI